MRHLGENPGCLFLYYLTAYIDNFCFNEYNVKYIVVQSDKKTKFVVAKIMKIANNYGLNS